MNILYYCWNENSSADIMDTFKTLGHNFTKVNFVFKDYNKDVEFSSEIENEIMRKSYDIIFSFDFFPIISHIAEKNHIPYVSWVYDMPHRTLFSEEIKNSHNYVFIFDYILYQNISKICGNAHVYHMPLAVNTERLTSMLGEPPAMSGECFDVSFVGSLYEGCLYNKINHLPEYIKGYLEGVMNIQGKIYGANLVMSSITQEVSAELKQYIKVDIPDHYNMSYAQILSDMINAKITSNDRINLLSKAAEKHRLTIFSGSDTRMIKGAENGGIISYDTEMPGVFRTSKININISLRSIESGIPLRALDVMGAGGFLLSNYQSELAEYFVDGEDLVLFSDEEDMLKKIDYYLQHDNEREKIAINGYNKVKKLFDYKIQVEKILNIVSNSEISTANRKISVIIPCYNCAEYVDKCLDSLVNQTVGLKNLEIILVDDASTDNTVDVLKKYEEKYPENIMIILCDKNGKQGTARNIGLMYSSGDYVSFVDSDDWVRKDMYEILCRIMGDSKYDIVQFRYTGKSNYEDTEDFISEMKYEVYDFDVPGKRKEYVLNSEIMNESCTTKFYKRELLINAGVRYAEGVAYEEPLFTYPLKYAVGKVAVIDTPLYYYRYNENGTTSSYMSNPATMLEHLDVQKQVYDFMKKNKYYNDYKEEIDLYFIHTFYAETFYFMKYRNMPMPISLYRYMSTELKKILPLYLSNIYLNDSSLIHERKLLECIDVLDNMSDDEALIEIKKIMTELQ